MHQRTAEEDQKIGIVGAHPQCGAQVVDGLARTALRDDDNGEQFARTHVEWRHVDVVIEAGVRFVEIAAGIRDHAAEQHGGTVGALQHGITPAHKPVGFAKCGVRTFGIAERDKD